MMVYLASPRTQQQAEHVENMPVLLSYGCYSPWIDRYQPTFSRVLIDSGAFSELTGAARVNLDKYRAWAARWEGQADAVAGLDDISGDWRRSLANYQAMPQGFPTFHDSDPWELLPELVGLAQERGGWLGIGMVPPRHGKEAWLRRVCRAVPEDVHLHGWALRAYTGVRRLDSVDSTNWWRDAMKYRSKMPWLTYGECLTIVCKRYKRWQRIFSEEDREITRIGIS